MTISRLAIVLLGVLLSGCWTGLNLYRPADAVPAIPAGVYMATASGEKQHVYRVTPLPNGMTQFESPEKKMLAYGFAPLGSSSFVAWWEIDPNPEGRPTSDDQNQMYALMAREADGNFRIFAPACSNEGRDLARKNGAVVGDGPSPTCRFPTRGTLEKALRALPRNDTDAMTLRRVP